jgi:hypothetical protein
MGKNVVYYFVVLENEMVLRCFFFHHVHVGVDLVDAKKIGHHYEVHILLLKKTSSFVHFRRK